MNAPGPGHVIRMYEKRQPIHPRETDGRFARLRWLCVWLTQLAYYGTPWLAWNGRQAVLFDLGARKFYLFGLVLWPQDFIYLAALLVICAWGLFLVTAVAGRVWCGFACPQTVYTSIFLWIERRIEGSRAARIALDRQGASPRKLGKRTAKHLAWGAVALWTGFTFVGYFTPVRDLGNGIATLSLGPWEWFWVLFYSLATYGNAGWLREQVCRYMCPYARFQSAMFDRDTLIITYDTQRGEPRGKKAANGACIDCTLCVQVCPAGIDIRNGLQYECIGCAACVDACDNVMDRTGQPRGLIRYSTDRAMAANLAPARPLQRALRPRVLAYGAALLAATLALGHALATRMPLKMDVIRDRGSMGREVDGGAIENVYRLQIMNTSERAHRYRIAAAGLPGLALATEDVVTLAATETRAVPVRLRAPHGAGHAGSNEIRFRLTALDDARLSVDERAVFIVPR
ncbi:cytochrome c oxidase accessory protein CcoG [Massilia dura]|uniref:Cytochrome c oxidase accessory protein CcoG n=1 Tax=Pseudoduganella dura TaxID=321982 RepID=A0A6I3XD05_9BURK|nr:cytochrome c oxidase accessory protein CcoG [Pseudoduganella dura]MUI13546.1 cytochrome c oxidase accessory protein CcoG [Pseudoduganella dura]